MSIKVFWLEPTDLCRVALRVHESREGCSSSRGYCQAFMPILDRAPISEWKEDGEQWGVRVPLFARKYRRTRSERIARDDPRWPSACADCYRRFSPAAHHQVWADDLHRGALDGQLHTLRGAPPGAMWDAWWLGEWYSGPDGIALTVRLPNGSDWLVDGEASNCTRPQREQRDGVTYLAPRTHYCWVRHGDPRSGDVHVDKNGNTCAAGAGSILSGDYHGFLHHGYLTT